MAVVGRVGTSDGTETEQAEPTPSAAIRDHADALDADLHADRLPAAVESVDSLLAELHRLRQELVTENVRRQKALMAEIDAKLYGASR